MRLPGTSKFEQPAKKAYLRAALPVPLPLLDWPAGDVAFERVAGDRPVLDRAPGDCPVRAPGDCPVLDLPPGDWPVADWPFAFGVPALTSGSFTCATTSFTRL